MAQSTPGGNAFLQQHYDALWANSIERIRAGEIDIDPVLARREIDLRRGITLLFRPTAPVQARIASFIEELRDLEPEQHYYHPAELHVTFLTPFTALVDHAPFFARSAEYLAALDAAVAGMPPFAMSFTGITASAGAVMVQGFTNHEIMNAARDHIRRELQERGLTAGLDTRYHIKAAHVTAVRFRQPLRNAPKFARALEQSRARNFGECRIDQLELVRNDWYQSRNISECLRVYPLTS